VLATFKEPQFTTLNVLPLFALCSDRVSALVVVFRDSPCEKSKNRRLV
jgi:hypothetical protein